jgi:hypothetical protein
MFSRGKNELSGPVSKGDEVKCPTCSEWHPVTQGKDFYTGEESAMLQFYRCGEITRLIGINGQLIKETEVRR